MRVALHQGGSEVALAAGAAELQVAEGPCTVVVSGLEPVSTVLLNDEPTPLVRTGRRDEGFLSLDLTNKVGFHRLTVRQLGVEKHFDFETTSAKATWMDIKAMAAVIASQVFALQRQFLYSTASGDRRAVWVPEVEFAWLRDRLPEIGALVERIDRAPAQESRRRFRTSNQARNVSVPHTLRLLREKRELLEQAEGGPIVVDGKSYWPSAVRVRETEKEPARIEHTQIATFLGGIARSLRQLRLHLPVTAGGVLDDLQAIVLRARSRSVILRHDRVGTVGAWTPMPTAIQRTDRRYGRLRTLQAEYMRDIHTGFPSRDAVRLNVRDAWEIYQTFAAHIIGKALGLEPIGKRADLRERSTTGVSMSSSEWELYYDVHPPSEVLSSWRSKCGRPADERPDIVLRHIPTGDVALLDVKFRVHLDKCSARSEDLFEMQAYMNSFGISRAAVIFPGTVPEARMLDASGFRLVELPVRPEFFDDEKASDALAALEVALKRVAGPRVSST